MFPIIGGRKVEHLKSNLAALSIRLTPEQIGKLEAIEEFDLGFPSSMVRFGLKPGDCLALTRVVPRCRSAKTSTSPAKPRV